MWRALGLYAAGSWLVLQIVDVLADNVGLPAWVFTSALILLIVGLPIVGFTAYFHSSAGKPGPGESEATQAARTLFTWRNALLGGVSAFALWGVISAVWMMAGSGSSGEGSRSTLAILPLEIRAATVESSDETSIFADGMHDDLLTQLSRIPELRVTSRTSVEEFRGAERNIRDIADQLGVSFIVEGAVDRVGDRVRINVQLIDAATDEHVWAETYDETMTLENLFAIRDDLTRRIASALQASLSPAVEAKLAQRPTESPEAFELYTRGRHLWTRGARPDVEQAIDLFERAAGLDPRFAEAHAALAGAHIRMMEYGFTPMSRGIPLARAAVERALAIDPENTDALIYRAYVLSVADRNIPEARRTLEEVLRLNPSSALGHLALANLNSALGYEYDAVENYSRARSLDPLDPGIGVNYSGALRDVGRHREALEQAAATLELHPDVEAAPQALSQALADVGRTEEAIEVQRRALIRNPKSIFSNEGLAFQLLDANRRPEALAQIQRAAEMTPDDYPIRATLSLMLRDAGRFEEALVEAREHVRLAPQQSRSRALLALSLLAVGDTGSAIAQLDSARNLDDRLHPEVARMMFQAGRVEEAVSASRRTVDDTPESVHDRIDHARLLFETAPWGSHSVGDALEALEDARRLSANEDFVLRAYGQVLRELGRTGESLAPYQRLAADQPESADSQQQLGWELLMGQRDVEAAGRAFRRALELNPVHDGALWGFARVELRQGRTDSAYAAMDRALDTCGRYFCQPFYGVRRGWLRAVGGDEDGAREALRQYEPMRNHPDYMEWVPVLAATHAELGDHDRAFELLDLAYDLRSTELLELKVEPWFDPLREGLFLGRPAGLKRIPVHSFVLDNDVQALDDVLDGRPLERPVYHVLLETQQR